MQRREMPVNILQGKWHHCMNPNSALGSSGLNDTDHLYDDCPSDLPKEYHNSLIDSDSIPVDTSSKFLVLPEFSSEPRFKPELWSSSGKFSSKFTIYLN
jgi:hypothetical protein